MRTIYTLTKGGSNSPMRMMWDEPQDWKSARERLREFVCVWPPWWRMAIYCFAVPLAAIGAAYWAAPDLREEFGVSIWLGLPLGTAFAMWLMPLLFSMLPRRIALRREFIAMGSARIPAADIIAVSFGTRRGLRYLVVRVRSRKGAQREVCAMLPEKHPSEEEIAKFLADVGLAPRLTPPDRSGDGGKDGEE